MAVDSGFTPTAMRSRPSSSCASGSTGCRWPSSSRPLAAVLTPAELLAGIDDRFRLLHGGRRRQRQRTLESTLDWSYHLLDDDEQRALRSLGVFVDTFDLGAAAAVSGTATMPSISSTPCCEVPGRASVDGVSRFRLLETVGVRRDRRSPPTTRRRRCETATWHTSTALATDGGPRRVRRPHAPRLRLRADRQDIAAAVEWATCHGPLASPRELIGGAASVFDLELAWVDGLSLIDHVISGCAGVDPELAEELRSVGLALRVGAFDPDLADHLVELAGSPSDAVRAVALAVGGTIAAMFALDPEPAITAAQAEIDAVPPQRRSRTFAAAEAALVARPRGRCRGGRRPGHRVELVPHRRRETPTATSSGSTSRTAPQGPPSARSSRATPTAASRRSPASSRSACPRPAATRSVRRRTWRRATWTPRPTTSGSTRSTPRRVGSPARRATAWRCSLRSSLAEGDAGHARDVLDRVSFTRTPAGTVFAEHLARRLGVLDGLRERKLAWIGADRADRARPRDGRAAQRAAPPWLGPGPLTRRAGSGQERPELSDVRGRLTARHRRSRREPRRGP